jgi:ATP-dependent DNA helicase 2 subunit 2
MSKAEVEGLVILLDVGGAMLTNLSPTTTYLQSCVDIIQMIAQRKMFQSSKDELALVLFGTRDTANPLWDQDTGTYGHITVARPLGPVDWRLIEFVQNEISASTLQADMLDGLIVATDHFHVDANKRKPFKDKRIIVLTDFSSTASAADDRLEDLIDGLSKQGVRIDLIHPFDEGEDDDNNDGQRPSTSQAASSSAHTNGTNG